MDYIKIYCAFIAQRKTIANEIDGYFEVHHVVPRSLGGTDAAENLVKLTPEDHFFAHLLLAKIHGGKMGSALFILMQTTQNRYSERTRSRGAYGLARRIAVKLLSENWTGKKNPLFNAEKFDWVSYRSGETRSATMFDMHREFGASRGSWTSVASGARPSIKGWLIKDRLAMHKKSEKGQLFYFVNSDGRSFSGTQTEFCKSSGVSDASAWRIVHNASVTKCGWRLSGVRDRLPNAPKSGGRSGPKGKTYRLVKDGCFLLGDRNEIAVALGSTVQQVSASLYSMERCNSRTYKGWAIAA